MRLNCPLYEHYSLSPGGSAVLEPYGQTGGASLKSAHYVRSSHVSNGLLECLLLNLAHRPSPRVPSQRASCHHRCPLRLSLNERLAPRAFNFHLTPNIALRGLSRSAGFSKVICHRQVVEYGGHCSSSLRNVIKYSCLLLILCCFATH